MATPEREVGLALHDRFDEPGVVIHRVLTVCVLDEDDLARDMTKTLADRVALALGLVLQNGQDAGGILGVLLHDLRVPSLELLSTRINSTSTSGRSTPSTWSMVAATVAASLRSP